MLFKPTKQKHLPMTHFMQRALSALVMAVALAVPCGAATPGQPELTMTFEILPAGER